MLDLQPIILIISFCVFVIGVALALGLHRSFARPSEEEDFQARLSELRRSELDAAEKDEKKDWFQYWDEAYRMTGRVPLDDNTAGRGLIIVGVLGLVIGALVFPGGIIGALLMPPVLLMLVRAVFSFEAQKRTSTLEHQLPLLVSSLRANVQSRSTPQSALMQVADEIPSPLGDELKILRSELNVNISLDQALRNFSRRVGSRQIKFLVSSIGMAVSSGQDLDPQLENIQTIIEERAQTERKLATAISSTAVATWVTALVIPGMFLYMWFVGDSKEFWMSLWGLAAIAVISVLYGLGLWMMRALVNNVRNT